MDNIWFKVLKVIKADMEELDISEGEQRVIIQEVKSESLKKLDLHGNMLNMRIKHIPQTQAIYKEVLKRKITQV